MAELINRITGSRLLISSLPGSASIMHVESRGLRSTSLAMSTAILEALPGKLYIKRHSPNIPTLQTNPRHSEEEAKNDNSKNDNKR